MEVLVLDGKEYIKASKAAKDLGYTSDYVGQLCRGGKVSAHLIGRSWYVDKEELGTHRETKKRMSKVKAREQAKKTLAEHRKQKNEKQKNYTKVAISYESDEGDLIPETRRVEIESEVPKQKKGRKSKESKANVIENEGEKIIMKGNLRVIDVSEGAPDPHVTILEPTILTEKERDATKPPKRKTVTKKPALEEQVVEEEQRTDFMAKLVDLEALSDIEEQNTNIITSEPTYVQEDGEVATTEQSAPLEEVSWWIPSIIILALLATTLLTLPLSKFIIYSADSVQSVSTSFQFNITETINLLRSKN